MSGPQPYSPGSTGTLSDVLERGPELAPFTPAGPDGFKAAPSLGDMFSAARPIALHDTVGPAYEDASTYQGYAPLLQQLGLPDSENPGYFANVDAAGEARFGNGGAPSMLATEAGMGAQVPFARNRMADRSLQESLIVDRIKAHRAKDPNFLPGVPDTVESLHAYFEQQQAAKRAAGTAVLARGGTVGRVATGLAAGLSVTDPVQLAPQLLMGGTASGVVQAAGRDALINGVLSSSQTLANIAEGREHPGSFGAGVEDVLTSGAEGAAAGAVLGAGAHVLGHIVAPVLTENLFKVLPESVQGRWAAKMKAGGVPLGDVLNDMDNRELATFSRSTLGDHMTADEKAAADTLERSQDLGDASPFAPGPVGDAAHNASLADALKRIVDRSSGSTDADLLASSSTVSLRSPAPVAVSEDPGFGAQWSAIKGNEHGIGSHGEFLTSRKGAVGPAQVMPGTAPYAAKLAGLPWDEARYRSDAGYNDAIGRAYYAEQLKTFGDPDKAAAAYNAGPGSAARGTGLRGAMRKAAEHGEPDNWEAFLPRETQRYVEDFRRRTGRAGAEAPVAAAGAGDGLAGEADAAEAQALELSRDRDLADAADLARDRADVADVPVLKRELFPDDQSWSDAQAAFHQSLNAPEEPARAPLSAETDAGGQSQRAAEGAPGARDRPLKPNDDYVAASYYYDGGSRQRVHATGGASAPNWVPRDGDVALGKFERGLGAGEAVAEVRHVRFKGEALTWVGVARRSVDAQFGDRSNVARFGVWLKDARLSDPARVLDRFDELSRWVSDEANAAKVGTSVDLQRAAEQLLADIGESVAPGSLKSSQSHPLLPRPEDLATGDLQEIATRLSEPGDSLPHAGQALPQVRIDEPALKAFDEPGGEGSKTQAESLEHDARMDVERMGIEQRNREVASAALERLTSKGRLPAAPKSLLQFLAKRGGIKDVGGDLAAMGAAKTRGFARSGERKLINPRGMGIDDAFAAAIDAGYFPEFNSLRTTGRTLTYADLPDLNTFLEAIDRELRGEPVYADDDMEAVFERARRADSDGRIASHLDDLEELANERGVALDEGTLDHALSDIERGTAAEDALVNAVHAAAMRDLGEVVADTGDLRYGVDNEGRPWDDEVNYAEHREAAANDRAPQPGERRPATAAADAAPGGAVAGEPEGPAGAPGGLGGRRYQLDENGSPKTLSEILEEIDRDRAAAKALRACAEGGGE